MQTMILAVVLAVALMLVGCGGGSKGGSVAGMPSGGGTPTPQTYGPGRTIPLPTGHTLETGTIPAGGSRTVVREADGMETVVKCTAGSENCRITVAADGTVTLIAGSLRIEIVGVRVVTPTTPTPPPTPPTRVIEPPLVSWGELPALVDRMTHRTELRSVHFPGTSCDDGVAACQAVVKDLLANATEQTGRASSPVKQFSGNRTVERELTQPGETVSYESHESFHGGWLDNSIFLVSNVRYHTFPRTAHGDEHYFRPGQTAYDGDGVRYVSMGIRDTNPVTGVYRGDLIHQADWHFSHGTGAGWRTFELTYTSGSTGGHLDFTIDPDGRPITWSNVSVDNEGYFNNDVRLNLRDPIVGPNKLEGRFYQGGEVGGVYSYGGRDVRTGVGDTYYYYGAFGGKLVPASP